MNLCVLRVSVVNSFLLTIPYLPVSLASITLRHRAAGAFSRPPLILPAMFITEDHVEPGVAGRVLHAAGDGRPEGTGTDTNLPHIPALVNTGCL